MSQERQVFTLKQVVSSIRKTIEERYHQPYWVKAEMHKLNLYPSGHAFPELVQKEDGKIVAQINGSIWKQNMQRINQQFMQVVNEPLKEGATMLMQVRISFHETFGLSLQIMDIDPSFTLGELQRERQETLNRLQKEGLINRNQQLEFPLLPQRVAIISADTSKGLSDFMKVLDQYDDRFAFFTMLFPAYLQGDVAVDSIIQQLRRIERVKHHFDVVVIVRGGGGEVGMSCYNNYELCKQIARFPLPILTGIGHSTNLTVAEMIAYRNAITPTDLADMLVQSFEAFQQPVLEAQEWIPQLVQKRLFDERRLFDQQVKQFQLTARHAMQEHQHSLQRSTRRLQARTEVYIEKNQGRLVQIKRDLEVANRRYQQHQQTILADMQQFISQKSMKIIERKAELLQQQEQVIRLLDPRHVLKRGYSISRFNGQTIAKSNHPQVGDKIEIETYHFTIESEVTNTKEHGERD